MAASNVKEGWAGGELVFAGGTDWAMLGRSIGKGGKKTEADKQAELARQVKYPNLPDPHRLKGLTGIKVSFIAAGSAAVHCIAGDMAGNCYTWGRNEKGQLGHGDLLQRNVPTLVTALKGKEVIGGCGGKHHTAVVTKDGDSYTWGLNTQGQCGTGSIKKGKTAVDDVLSSPAKALVENAHSVQCGADFTVWLCDGKLYAAGNPQYGQLGDGSDHMYNAKDSSIKIMHEPQPTPLLVAKLCGVRIVTHACGHSHSIAVDDAGTAYTWGNGNYGKLGHKVQQDEFEPRAIDTFKGRLAVPKDAVVSVGGTATFCTAVGGQLYAWGRLKQSGDNTTYPQPLHDLSGWHIRSMACGPGHYAIAADTSVITWGHASNGELGYGALGKKSSANPDKCAPLDNVYTHQVACGAGFTLFLCDPDADGVQKLKVWEPAVDAEAAAEVADEAGGKAAGKAGGAGTKRKAAGGKASSSKKAK